MSIAVTWLFGIRELAGDANSVVKFELPLLSLEIRGWTQISAYRQLTLPPTTSHQIYYAGYLVAR
jgi:hypothetical protein